jgi:hypothetical protein
MITDLGGFAPTYKSNETGEIEEEQQFIKVGTVIEVGHKCEFLKPGDIVFYNSFYHLHKSQCSSSILVLFSSIQPHSSHTSPNEVCNL